MSRQTPRIPRFYIDYGQYLVAQGLEGLSDNQIKALQLNPTELKNIDSLNIGLPDVLVDNTLTNYIAILGHIENPYGFGYSNPKVNLDGLPGWSLYVSEEPNAQGEINFNYGNPIGALSVGHYFDMPHAPDISLSISKEYDGVKQVKTKGGATLSNATYTSVPRWGDLPAWQIGEDGYSRTGRRVWSLNFSFLSPSAIMGENEMSSPYKENVEAGFDTTLIDNNDFFSRVINGTLGHLPFIFQPDNSVFQPDQFAICRFDMNSFNMTQTSPNLYSMSLKIRESW